MGSLPGGEGSSMGSSSRGAAPSRAIRSRSAARKAASGAALPWGDRSRLDTPPREPRIPFGSGPRSGPGSAEVSPSDAKGFEFRSLSGFPEDLIIKPARIVLSSEIDIPGRCISPTLERSSAFFSEVKDRLVVVSRGNGPGSSCIAIRIPMGRRDGPELPSAEMAHVEAPIACCAEGRPLIVGPVLLRHPIGRKALPPVIPVAVAPCVKTAQSTQGRQSSSCVPSRKSF